MRSVTTNPPTTLAVPSATASERDDPHPAGRSGSDATMIAPTTTMPWIAFDPDMSGVCRSVGTFEIDLEPEERREDQHRRAR